MRIGLDATAIPLNRAGAGNYIFNLMAGLARIDAENQYFIFSKPEHIKEWKITQPNFLFLSCASGYRPLRLAWEQCVLPMMVRQHKIDLLHSPHYTMPLLCPCRSVVTFCDMIFFLHPEVHSLSKRIFFRAMMSASSRRADAIIAISESTARDVRDLLRVAPDKVHAIPLAAGSNYRPIADRNAVNRVCRQYGLQAGEYVLFIGVLEPRKNIPVLLHAYRELANRGIRQKLAIVGKKGWMFDEIFSTVQTLKIEDKVVFTGYVPEKDLPALYNGACLFVYPSLYEGFGLPVLEAMSCGTPVVTSNVSSMPEIVGDAGILVDPHDVHQLTEGLIKVISDDNLGRSLRQRGLERAAHFSWERTARETLQVYYNVCKSKPAV
jgi:glycosyltransferase involved in cell wall biosynthesis